MTFDPSAREIQLGDLRIGRLGLGTNRLTDTPANADLLAQALEWGLNFIDTADVYTYGASETTLGKYLSPFRAGLVVATKGGIVRGQPPNGSPAHLRQAVEDSLRRLRTDCIDLYQLHMPDPAVPLVDSVSALQELRQAGKIRHIGLSNVSVAQLDLACNLGPIVSVQNEYNLAERQHQDVLAACERRGIVFLPYFPLTLGAYQGQVEALARKYTATPAQISLAWLLQLSGAMAPIPGTLSPAHLADNLAATNLTLEPADLAQLNAPAESNP